MAALHGVSPSLAAAIAWQESGFNNAMVSSANARGVMQVMPGTWSYVQDNLADRALDPNSATDNVHAGVLYLKRLLNETGGDESAAIAGYYQGLASVRSRGMYDDTRDVRDTSSTSPTCRRSAPASAASPASGPSRPTLRRARPGPPGRALRVLRPVARAISHAEARLSASGGSATSAHAPSSSASTAPRRPC